MKNSEKQDERIVAQQRKIGNEAFYILFFGLFLSIIVQEYVFRAPFAQFSVEFIFFISIGAYIIIRSLISGNNLFGSVKNSQKAVVLNSVICALIIAASNTMLNYIKLGDLFLDDINNTFLISIVTFVFSLIFIFVVFETLFLLNNKRQKQIDKKYMDKDE